MVSDIDRGQKFYIPTKAEGGNQLPTRNIYIWKKHLPKEETYSPFVWLILCCGLPIEEWVVLKIWGFHIFGGDYLRWDILTAYCCEE